MAALANVWLYANDFNSGGQWATYTVVVPNRNVFAYTAVSTYVPVGYADQIGGSAIGARILGYSYYENETTTVGVATPLDWNQNSLFIDNCASVTFGLQCKNAWGYSSSFIEQQ
jgi:hypothetical protein